MKVLNRRIPDRYVRWCESTDRELIPIFLLDPLTVSPSV